jgi:hypothetical protein
LSSTFSRTHALTSKMTDMTTQANSLELIAITYADGDDAGDAQVSRGPPSALPF